MGGSIRVCVHYYYLFIFVTEILCHIYITLN